MNRLTSLRCLRPTLFCIPLAGPAVAYEVGDWAVVQLTE